MHCWKQPLHEQLPKGSKVRYGPEERTPRAVFRRHGMHGPLAVDLAPKASTKSYLGQVSRQMSKLQLLQHRQPLQLSANLPLLQAGSNVSRHFASRTSHQHMSATGCHEASIISAHHSDTVLPSAHADRK